MKPLQHVIDLPGCTLALWDMLRNDPDWDRYCAEVEGQTFDLVSLDEAEDGLVSREHTTRPLAWQSPNVPCPWHMRSCALHTACASPHATVCTAVWLFPSTSVYVPATLTGTQPVHIRPTSPPYEHVHSLEPGAHAPAPGTPQLTGHLSAPAHSAFCSSTYARTALSSAAATSGSSTRSLMGASS